MASWNEQTPSGNTFNTSPTDSLLSAPGEMYPSLFTPSTPTPNTLDPQAVMSPPTFITDFKKETVPSAIATTPSARATSVASTRTDGDRTTPAADGEPAATEKKPAKKRKSWGQVLPEPKTNLPPRKRAKTEDEKEQRRVERVLRNRRAAQSSRERKRQEVEALELRNKDLEARIHDIEKTNMMLIEELNKYRLGSGVVTRSSSLLDSLPGSAVALSQELFSSQDGHKSLIDGLVFSEPTGSTVDPSSLSPEPTEQMMTGQTAPPSEAAAATPSSTASSTTDLTQRPAAMLCDLQCQQSGELPRSWTASQTTRPSELHSLLVITTMLASACQRPLTQIAMSLKAGFSLPPTPSILKAIIFAVTRPRSSRRTRSTSPNSSTRTEAQLSKTQQRRTGTQSRRTPNSVSTLPTLRVTSLQKILTCSPNLARPLQDATMEALRLVSEGCHDQAGNVQTSNSATRDQCPKPTMWLDNFPCPSKEVLLTLLWALKVEERKLKSAVATSGPSPSDVRPTNNHVKVVPGSRKRGSQSYFQGLNEKKRKRLG